MHIYKDTGGFLSLIGLLLTLAIICYLFYIVINTYFKIPSLDKKTKRRSFGQSVVAPIPKHQAPAPNYRRIMDHARDKIKDINKQILNRER